jgi:hypothetical protein
MQGIGFAIVGFFKQVQWAIEDRIERIRQALTSK